jgi:hypothetical protein
MGCCCHVHGPWCGRYGYGYAWGPPDEPAARRRPLGPEGRIRELEDRQAQLQEELAELSELLRRVKESE